MIKYLVKNDKAKLSGSSLIRIVCDTPQNREGIFDYLRNENYAPMYPGRKPQKISSIDGLQYLDSSTPDCNHATTIFLPAKGVAIEFFIDTLGKEYGPFEVYENISEVPPPESPPSTPREPFSR